MLYKMYQLSEHRLQNQHKISEFYCLKLFEYLYIFGFINYLNSFHIDSI